MDIQNPTISHHSTSPFIGNRQPQASHFAKLLAPGDAATDRTEPSRDDQARQAAESLVSITLIDPLLAQAREDPFRTDLFHGGFAEEAFGAQFDAIIAERLTHAAQMPIVESVYNQLMSRGVKVNTHG